MIRSSDGPIRDLSRIGNSVLEYISESDNVLEYFVLESLNVVMNISMKTSDFKQTVRQMFLCLFNLAMGWFLII